MVAIDQLADRQTVILKVAGSIPAGHPFIETTKESNNTCGEYPRKD